MFHPAEYPSQSVKLMRIRSKAGNTTNPTNRVMGISSDRVMKIRFCFSSDLIIFPSFPFAGYQGQPMRHFEEGLPSAAFLPADR